MFKQVAKKIPFLADLLRRARIKFWERETRLAIPDYLDKTQTPSLNIGSSYLVLEGWFNTDIAPFSQGLHFLDATKIFPFSNDCFDFIVSEHTLEHITHSDFLFMVSECYRVLKPGGTIRLSTPDLEKIALLYQREHDPDSQRYIQEVVENWSKVKVYSPCVAINAIFGHGHRFVYDFQMLSDILKSAGFSETHRHAIGNSSCSALTNIDSYPKIFMRGYESVYIEGVKMGCRG